MKTLQDIRYQADGPKTSATEAVVLPLWLQIDKPTHQIATREARSLVESLQAELQQFKAKGGILQMGDLGKPQVQKTSKLVLEQQSNEEVRLQLEFFLVLTLEPGQFWERAELIAQAIDFIQRFCIKPRDKRILIHMQTARFLEEGLKTQASAGTAAAS
ncbi:MAG TPA: hypothetical protein VFA71_13740 [Terriglobales bacterium]|nr:hypothetical protein [Terriglobales bacterium]